LPAFSGTSSLSHAQRSFTAQVKIKIAGRMPALPKQKGRRLLSALPIQIELK
jgi:hypothetical protein